MDQALRQDPRVEKGAKLLEQIWWRTAKRILLIAAEHYGWDDDQLIAAQDIFLKSSHYYVTVTP